LAIAGTLSDESDEDWYTFDTVDTDEKIGNSYHIEIAFTANSEEFVFDVVRGEACTGADMSHSNLTSYTWCVDGTSGGDGGMPIGEKECGKFDGGTSACGDHSTPYFLRVHRNPSYTAPGSCSTYNIKVTGRGGTKCDFTQACDGQTTE